MARICENCGDVFPSTIKINGVWKTLNKRKYCLNCSPWNQHNTRQIKNSNTAEIKCCPRCKETKRIEDFYVRKNRRDPSAYCINCSKIQSNERVRDAKRKFVEYKGGKCQSCGYDKCVDAMDFHHVNRNEKKFDIGKGRCLSWNKIKIELDKCVLVCCRCHREIEAGVRPCPEICLSGAIE